MLQTIRRALLYRAFELLYGPLVLLHEPLGRLVHGPAWSGRRVALAHGVQPANWIIELGSGEGRLIAALEQRAIVCTGFEPSRSMRRRARACSPRLVNATAQCLPVPDGVVDIVLISYPGPWIFDPATWTELARVLRVTGNVQILAGGTYGDGSGLNLRRRLLAAIYGRSAVTPVPVVQAGMVGIRGTWHLQPDRWGSALIWSGVRTAAK